MLLKESLQIKGYNLKNRLVLPPMATAKSTADGYVTDLLCEYYSERAKTNAIGLIICEHCFIDVVGKAKPGQLSIASDDTILGHIRLTNVIHQSNTFVIAQINHAGGATNSTVTNHEAIAPSAILGPNVINGVVPKAMTNEDIVNVKQQFVAAALRAKAANYDGVEIHAAHGYLLNQFYSPYTNKRTDDYNGTTIEGRTRLLVEIVKAVKNAIGEKLMIAVRLGAIDYLDGGTTIEDSVKAAKILEAAGVDILDISGGLTGSSNPHNSGQGYFKEISGPIKEAVSIPVILTGGITSIEDANDLLLEGVADLIGVGRPILKDASWPKELGN